MASSSRSHGQGRKPYRWSEKEASSSAVKRRPGKELAETRNWLEDLPRDVTIAMLQKVGTIDILENIQKVCVSWRKICKDPTLWRSIDMRNTGDFQDMPYDLVEMTKHAIDRSCGQLLDINLEYFGNNDLLKYITDSTNQLRRLRIVLCWAISDEGISEAAKKLPYMEELHIYFGNITNVGLENVGRSCPSLKSLTYNQQGVVLPLMDSDEDEVDLNVDALAISRTMPQLHHLSLFGNQMTNEGLEAILDACPHLESLDLRQCFGINLSGPLGKRCSSSIKALRLPDDSTSDYEFDATVYKGCGYNSYDDDYLPGFSDTDLVTDDDEDYASLGYDSFDDNENVSDVDFL
ncbi:F-box protein SKIP19-like [Impatiens glandulifera]|uniref:F-box protein SKIP19-like n=1 Tax=Impatiens glandulifera TaxID=253017 RepID=UPI001FB05293|nr:F-box protein SKIP19-like [Impatiens glandulifera]XP_047308393.1 F-box protein SKIP19-like [Impatiens glandulifera]